MKNTGIVRRIDDLGRIVIPKELRKVLNLKEGEQLEIYTNDEGELMLKKFCSASYHKLLLEKLCKELSLESNKLVLVCDRNVFMCGSGENKALLIANAISQSLGKILDSRRKMLLRDASIELSKSLPTEKCQQYVLPIIANGDLFGGLVMQGSLISESDIGLCDLACHFMAMLFEQ